MVIDITRELSGSLSFGELMNLLEDTRDLIEEKGFR